VAAPGVGQSASNLPRTKNLGTDWTFTSFFREIGLYRRWGTSRLSRISCRHPKLRDSDYTLFSIIGEENQ
jgi:hypothetical protein